MKSLYLKEYGATIRYHEIGGEGPAVIYLAALNCPSVANFLPTVTHHAMPRRRSILVDYLGTGHSDRLAAFDHKMQSHANTVAHILDAENLRGCVVVGHSMGGTVGAYLAFMRPDLVSHLVVCEGNITPGGGVATRQFTSVSEQDFVANLFPQLLNGWRKEGQAGNAVSAWRCGAWQNVDFAGIYRSSAALVKLDPAFKSRFLNLPMQRTFVYGQASLPENTGEITPDAPDPTELKSHGVSVAVVPNVGHMMMLPTPDGFAEVMASLL